MSAAVPAGPLSIGSTIGIVGGGQLGRMLAMAAARLGYRTVVLEPQPDCPAAQVANRQIVAAYDDPAALAELAAASSIVTYEFENVPVEAAAAVGAGDRDALVMETLMAFKRAGCTGVLTYHALHAARLLNG